MTYLIRRLEFFIIPRVMPGSPAEAMLVRFHGRASPQTIRTLEIALGFHTNESVLQQYGEYLWNMAHLNFGTSLTFFPSSVGNAIMVGLPWTVGLVGLSTVVAFLL